MPFPRSAATIRSASRQRRRRPVGADAQQPPGRKVGDDDEVAGGQVCRASVLVDARPDVDAGRADVADAALTRPPDQRLATVVVGAALKPRDGATVPARLGEPDEPGRDQVQATGEGQLPYGATVSDAAPSGSANRSSGDDLSSAAYVPLFHELE